MRRPPVPRERVYKLYWQFASKRHAAFERRVAGVPWPWTDDPIIQTFKFCNVFRAADRVSQYLIRDVIYHDENCSTEDRLFQIVAFRIFSNIETWRKVRERLGHHPTLRDLADGSFSRTLEFAKQHNGRLYTGAFILCAANPYDQTSKYLNHVELFKHMFLRGGLAAEIVQASSLRSIYEMLHPYPLMGDFMSYQLAIDLNYSPHVNFSEDAFTQPGPGALRGIHKVFESLGDYGPSEVISWMVERQEDEFARLGLKFGGLWGRRLHAIDCQGLFCETDKYCREVVPELASARRRIKAKFVASSEPIRLFFPPRWNINDRLPAGYVLGSSLGAAGPASPRHRGS